MATAKKGAAPEMAGPVTKGLRIVSRRESGFRRAGRYWGPEPTDISLAELAPADVDALRDEKNLVVLDIDMPAAEEPQT